MGALKYFAATRKRFGYARRFLNHHAYGQETRGCNGIKCQGSRNFRSDIVIKWLLLGFVVVVHDLIETSPEVIMVLCLWCLFLNVRCNNGVHSSSVGFKRLVSRFMAIRDPLSRNVNLNLGSTAVASRKFLSIGVDSNRVDNAFNSCSLRGFTPLLASPTIRW